MTELVMHLHGPHEAIDAHRVINALGGLLNLLEHLEPDPANHLDSSPKSTWAISRLEEDGAIAALAPLEPHGESSHDLLEEIQLRLVEGFRKAEIEPIVPAGWSLAAVASARNVAAQLDPTTDTKMRISLVRRGERVAFTQVTHRSNINLRKATQTKHVSLGSATGRISSINIHRTKAAGLWLEHNNTRVKVDFDSTELETVKEALGKRVTVRGRIQRNAKGQPLSIALKSLELLPSADQAPPLRSLIGVLPGLIKQLNVTKHLEEFH